jgi:hypothetical protein
MGAEPVPPSPWRVRSDLAWARGLLWFAQSGSGGREPKRDVHLFMADRYGRLADYHAGRGSEEKARRFALRAEWHYRAAGPDDPPQAVAIAMPVPGTKPVDLVSEQSTDGDDVG